MSRSGPVPSAVPAAGPRSAGERSAAVTASIAARLGTRFGPRVILAAVAVFLVAVPFCLVLLLVESHWPAFVRADFAISERLHQYAVGHTAWVLLMKAFSYAGSAQIYLPVLAVLGGWLLWQRRPRIALFVVATALGSSLLNTAVKAAVSRARPVLPHPVETSGGWSFPSGHAQGAITTYLLILVALWPVLHGLWRRAAVAVAAVMVAGIGFSRIALGVHFLSDVVAGYALGAAWLAVAAAVFGVWRIDRPGVNPQ
jgi:membrane-associated phospholipid phosphatase